mmetsp:Transcript_15461/g.31305  ORF Transcript_15461/g.31305 Transcript_15461/m.31305 type:complete len:484 (-) Transcript_15461:12-1463(-)
MEVRYLCCGRRPRAYHCGPFIHGTPSHSNGIRAKILTTFVVAILGSNSVEWVVADVGCILAGGIATGIYPTSSAEVAAYVVNNCHAACIVVEGDLLHKILELREKFQHVKSIVVYGDLDHVDDGVIPFHDFLAIGSRVPNELLDGRVRNQKPECGCMIVYSSGTTGPPKAAMISHDNIHFVVETVRQFARITNDDKLVSFLPLNHVAANMIDIKGPLLIGFSIRFARKDALKGSLVETLREARPTVFFGVPRVFEKIQDKLMEIGQSGGWWTRMISQWAKSVGVAAMDAEDGAQPPPPLLNLAQRLVFDTVKSRLGLDQCRYIVSTAAPLPIGCLTYFRSLHMRICDLYGATEATGPITVNRPWDYKVGSSGSPIPGVEVRILGSDQSKSGEILMRSRNVFLGYLNDPVTSEETIDCQGFLHTGDLGYFDQDGHLWVTGRIKDIIITAGGENVAPVPIEEKILERCPALARVIVVGDSRRFLS